jgi:hypothetical protein
MLYIHPDAKLGVIDKDHPLIEVLPPQNQD